MGLLVCLLIVFLLRFVYYFSVCRGDWVFDWLFWLGLVLCVVGLVVFLDLCLVVQDLFYVTLGLDYRLLFFCVMQRLVVFVMFGLWDCDLMIC